MGMEAVAGAALGTGLSFLMGGGKRGGQQALPPPAPITIIAPTPDPIEPVDPGKAPLSIDDTAARQRARARAQPTNISNRDIQLTSPSRLSSNVSVSRSTLLGR